jgi:hypothetical protein
VTDASHVDSPAQDSILLQTLRGVPGDALCERCLSAICVLSSDDVRIGTSTLLERAELERARGCASCHRDVASLIYRVKCSHCGSRFAYGDKPLRLGEELFHVSCLRRLITDDTIRLSRALGRRSRRLIEESRRRVREGREGWPPLESP